MIRKLPAGTPATWYSRMVVTAKANGSPRRTVDLRVQQGDPPHPQPVQLGQQGAQGDGQVRVGLLERVPFHSPSSRIQWGHNFQLYWNPSQVNSNLRLVVSLLLHCLFFSCFCFLSAFIIGPLQMLISQSILNRFWSNFGFYISWPILTKYMIPLRISTTQNLN